MKENYKYGAQTKDKLSYQMVLLCKMIISNSSKRKFDMVERKVVDKIRDREYAET